MAYLQQFLYDAAFLDEQGQHMLYLITPEDYAKLPVKRWKHNRPEDPTRIGEIREWIQTSKRVDGILYIACIDNELVCYESNHRREALKGLEGIHKFLIDIMWNATDEAVKQEFLRLNKSVCVPELYVSEEPEIRISELKIIVENFCDNYKKLRVSTNRPQRPNFNRDMITDEFYRIMKEKQVSSVDNLIQILTGLNKEMSMRDKSKLTPKIIQKCEESGLWLFAWSSKIDL